jgi:flagellar basal body-associated protein FliL
MPKEITKKNNNQSLSALAKIKRSVYIFSALVLIVLVVAGYFAVVFITDAYNQAQAPTTEQIDTYLYEVKVDQFQDIISTINQRQLY